MNPELPKHHKRLKQQGVIWNILSSFKNTTLISAYFEINNRHAYSVKPYLKIEKTYHCLAKPKWK